MLVIKPNSRPSALRVLVVEDCLVNRQLLTALLSRLSCDISTAVDGKSAVEKFREEEFDVVLMDVQMPVMDGLTATRLIRKQEAGTEKRTPIVAITAGMDRQRCLDAGMDEYLGKPVRAKSLYQKLEWVLADENIGLVTSTARDI